MDEKLPQSNRGAAVSPIRRQLQLGAVAVIISAYAVYGLMNNDLSLANRSSNRVLGHIHFTGTSAWILAVAIWIVAAGLVIAIFEDPTTGPAKNRQLPTVLPTLAYFFVGSQAHKKQRLSVLVCFVGFIIGGVTFLLRLTGAI